MIEHRVVGPPGTGKTTYLTRQCQVAAEKYGGGGIVVASLTKTAAKEVVSRATGVPPQNIGTLHAHSFRRMERKKQICESAGGIQDWNERASGSWRLTNASNANPEHDAPMEARGYDSGGDELLAEMGVLRQRMRDRRLWPQRVVEFADAWDEFKEDTGRIDFTDMIEVALEEIDMDAAVLMLDEAQDMSRLEMELARKWGAQCQQIVVVGDPDQNLYQWRGSDPDAFFAGDAASQRVLEQSYRVPGAVHSAAVGWIRQIEGRVDAAYRPREAVGAVVHHPGTHHRDAEAVADLVAELRARGSVMVLGSCGYMVNPLVAVLRRRAIPFWNPYRPTQGAWNPLNGARRLLAFLRPQDGVWGDEARLWTWDDVYAWVEPMVAQGNLRRGMKALIQRRAAGGRFDDQEDKLIMRVAEVLECFEDECMEAIYSQDIDWWHAALKHDDHKRQQFVVDVAKRHGGRTLREKPDVIVGTIHSVKGGEADHVILMPDLSQTAYAEGWLTKGEGRDAVVRQFYVGMTRARHELHLLDAAGTQAVQWR